ncbi:tetratricopeptide repeat protein [Streptomyces sp. NPDC002187]|uniref:tetratricopeptide repeat protein n=1 Tax=Streptomyces sp. NPDC002187 TaxID=3364637 RepID=UPI0036D1B0D7
MSVLRRTSNSSPQEESWRVCLLRTPDRAGKPLGGGVLLPGGLVLTCAHTVLSRPDQSGARIPLDTVYVDLPRVALSDDGWQPVPARVLREYLVPPTGYFSGDLALLKLDHEPDVPYAVLHRQIPARGAMVHVIGYPGDLPGGEDVNARLMSQGGPGPRSEWVQLDTQGPPYVVRHGYSGCGVVDNRSGRVIGIVAHQFGTPNAPVRQDHAYMISTETVLRHLPLERLGLTVTGARAISRDVAVATARTASGRVPGLHRRLTRWLDGEPGTDPVELAFAGEGEHELLHTIRSVLTLADREQSPPDPAPPSGTSAGEPQIGSIDIAVDATNRTAADLARQLADRMGLDDSGAHTGDDRPERGPDASDGRGLRVPRLAGGARDPAGPPDGPAPRANGGAWASGSARPGGTVGTARGNRSARADASDASARISTSAPADGTAQHRSTAPSQGPASAPYRDAPAGTTRTGGPVRSQEPEHSDGHAAPAGATARPGGQARPDGPTPSPFPDGTSGSSPDAAHTALLDLIAHESPPLIAAFLSIDRSASTDTEIVDLLRALLARGDSRLLLVFSDPSSPLVGRIRAELLRPDWAEHRAERLAARVKRLADAELRLRQLPGPGTPAAGHPRRPEARAQALRERLRQIGPGGTRADDPTLPQAQFRLTVDIETALLDVESAEQELAGPMGPREFVVEPPGDGLTDLPVVAVRDPDALVTAPAGPHLTGGDRLHQQYEVVGPIGQGSHGQVYLARDLLLEMRPVALKGILDPDDPAAVRQAHQERLRLVSLNHPSVIRVVNYARHPSTSAEFIVMEFANGAPLSWVAARMAEQHPPFAGPRVREFIVSYGLLVLDALSYLHDQEQFVYGDLSLTNVLHCGNGIKLIDVAGVRRPGAPGPVSHRPPEAGAAGEMTTAGDLYTVGALLTELLDKDPAPPADLGTESLQRALRRAMETDPRLRYASAQEMAVQLRGVLRELRSLRLGEETFQPSPLFDPAAIALDGRLGKAPPLERWREDGSGDGLGAQVPGPSEAAVALPVPKPDEEDLNWKELQRTSYEDPAGLLQLSDDWLPSPELHLLRCRLHLELAGGRRRSRYEELVTAAMELDKARRLLGERASYDWRLDWHEGLTELAHGRLPQALGRFDDVYAAIPGEYAPKLALGYCHEKLADQWRGGDPDAVPDAAAQREAHEEQAMRFYDAVWRRNHALGAAAFGLARIHLARRRPDLALASLDGVPPDSRHRTAARTAMVRIHAGPPQDGDVPTVGSAARAFTALHRLAGYEGLTDRHAYERLTAELRELLLNLVVAARERGTGNPLAELRAALPPAIPVPATERTLREQLSASYRQLAKQVARTDRPQGAALVESLLDNAYRTRPLGLRHHRRPDRRPRPAWLGGRGGRA